MRADRPPTEGFVTVVDGLLKSEFDTVEAAEASARKLHSAYPMLQIEIFTKGLGPSFVGTSKDKPVTAPANNLIR